MVGRMTLVHYSSAPVERVYAVDQIDVPHFKPNGLWVSVEGKDGWRYWCEENEYGRDSLKYVHDVVLRPGANILRCSGGAEISLLTARYMSGSPEREAFNYRMIDWRRIASEFQGIIIAPYIWSERLSNHNLWYYAWDCASGCIWDPDAIESIKLRVEAPC